MSGISYRLLDSLFWQPLNPWIKKVEPSSLVVFIILVIQPEPEWVMPQLDRLESDDSRNTSRLLLLSRTLPHTLRIQYQAGSSSSSVVGDWSMDSLTHTPLSNSSSSSSSAAVLAEAGPSFSSSSSSRRHHRIVNQMTMSPPLPAPDDPHSEKRENDSLILCGKDIKKVLKVIKKIRWFANEPPLGMSVKARDPVP